MFPLLTWYFGPDSLLRMESLDYQPWLDCSRKWEVIELNVEWSAFWAVMHDTVDVVFNFWSVEALFTKVVRRPILDVIPEDWDVVVSILPGLLVPYACNS